jgi:cyclophilin family peptidyl-prolyl cis-trans isomerase
VIPVRKRNVSGLFGGLLVTSLIVAGCWSPPASPTQPASGGNSGANSAPTTNASASGESAAELRSPVDLATVTLPAVESSQCLTADLTEPTVEVYETSRPPRNAQQFSAPEVVIDPTHVYCATLVTAKGNVIIELYPHIAPQNVNNFVFLAQQGFYNDITWHRVLPGFVAQTGDPTARGDGGPGYNIPLEVVANVKYSRPGLLGVARAMARDSAGSQWFITYDALPGLDPNPQSEGYTIMGQVVRGQEVVEQIRPRDPQQQPNYYGDPLITVIIDDVGERQ